MINKTKKIFYIFFPLLIGIVNSIVTKKDIEIYKTIKKPSISPPSYLFGIIWTILFLLMGISFYFLKRKTKNQDISNIEFSYYLQLIVNFFWSIFFFKNQAYSFSFIWLVFLLVLVIITFIKFYKNNKISSYLLIPYILWIIFAGYLNFQIAILN